MSVEFEVLKALKTGGQADTYAVAKAAQPDDENIDVSSAATRLVTMEGLGLVERLDEDTMYGSTEWAITPQGLDLLKAQA